MRLETQRFHFPYSYMAIGVFVALIVFFLWSYAGTQIWGYWALWRFNEHWPIPVQFTVPLIFFAAAIVFPTLYLLTRIPRDMARAAIISLTILFSVVEAYTYTEMGSSGLAWFTLAARTIVVIAGALIAWRFIRP